MKVPVFVVRENPDENDENEISGYRMETAVVHLFECEKTKTERVWGCDSPTEAS